MQQHVRCKIDFADRVHPPVKNSGVVHVLGESPTATVRISDYDFEQRKFVTIDRLTRAKISDRRGALVIEGTSTFLNTDVGAEGHTQLTVTVKPGQKCENCP